VKRSYRVAMILATLALFVAAVAINVRYTASVQQQADRRYAAQQKEANRRFAAQQAKAEAERQATNRLWCELFAAVDPAAPPTTTRGRQVDVKIGRLRTNYGCEAK
jgi:hypothetical protein